MFSGSAIVCWTSLTYSTRGQSWVRLGEKWLTEKHFTIIKKASAELLETLADLKNKQKNVIWTSKQQSAFIDLLIFSYSDDFSCFRQKFQIFSLLSSDILKIQFNLSYSIVIYVMTTVHTAQSTINKSYLVRNIRWLIDTERGFMKKLNTVFENDIYSKVIDISTNNDVFLCSICLIVHGKYQNLEYRVYFYLTSKKSILSAGGLYSSCVL